jgi:hypothetical protein
MHVFRFSWHDIALAKAEDMIAPFPRIGVDVEECHVSPSGSHAIYDFWQAITPFKAMPGP